MKNLLQAVRLLAVTQGQERARALMYSEDVPEDPSAPALVGKVDEEEPAQEAQEEKRALQRRVGSPINRSD